MTLAEEFRIWARDPARTSDELYVVELFVEAAQTCDDRRKKIWRVDYEAQREKRRRRMLNPAYRPELSRAQIDLVVEFWSEINTLENGTSINDDRPVADFSPLRFFPHLKTLRLRTAVRDLRPLAVLPELKSLQLDDEVLADLGGLAALKQLEDLQLWFKAPWPKIAAIGSLPALRSITYHGNLLVWLDVPELPAVENIMMFTAHEANTPLRDARELPAMPKVKSLHIERIADLRGIERFATAQNLVVAGPFVDLEPLAALGEVRKLKLSGEDFIDLHPVARMPRLHTLELWRYRGLDVAPLAEAPRLRLVEAKISDVIKTEVASLNAAIGFVDESMFVAEERRPAVPLRFISYDVKRADYPQHRRRDRRGARDEVFEDDPLVGPAEEKWFTRQVTQRFDDLLTPGWGTINAWQAGNANIELHRLEDAVRLREIVFAVRDVMLGARFPWHVMLDISPPAAGEEPEDDEEEEDKDDDDTAFELEREEWQEHQQRWKEHKEYLEREHRMRLQQQEGREINPETFAVPPAKGQAFDPSTREPDDDAEQAASGRDEEFSLTLYFNSDIVSVHASDAARAAYYLEEKFEDWHALPEPPDQRPSLP